MNLEVVEGQTQFSLCYIPNIFYLKQRNKRNWVIFDTDAKQSYEIKVYGYLSLEKFFVGYLFSLPNFKSSAAPDC